jgi:DNA-binding SARP family transcriptional activator
VRTVEFRILGPLEVWHDGGLVPVTGGKQRAILTVLLLHAGEVVSTDRLIDALWGAEPPEAGATALRVRLSQLRKALGDAGELIVTRPPGYVLALQADQLDLRRFERLVAAADRAMTDGAAAEAVETITEALSLWRGPPLADLAYEAFAQAPVVRLEELRLAALELRVDAELTLGRHAQLIGELQVLAREHPLRERLWGQLMLALYRDGRQAEALEVYRDARRRLVDEVGIEPGPQLQELERRILAQDPALVPESRACAPRPVRPRAVVVVPEFETEGLAALAEPLAARDGEELIVAALVDDREQLGDALARVHAVRTDAVARGVTARAAAFVTADRGADVVRLAAEQDAALLLIEAPEALLASGAIEGHLDTILAGAVCDVGIVAGPARPSAGAGAAILVPFAGHEHDWSAIELGSWLATARDSPLRLVGARGDQAAGQRDASRLLSSASLALQRGVGVAAESLLVRPGTEDMLEAAASAAVVVAGLAPRWTREGLGRARTELARRARPPVVLVRRGLRPGGLAPAHALTRFTWSAG